MGNHPVGTHGFFGKPAEELGGIGGLAHRVSARLAVFQGDQTGKILQPFGHQLPRAPQDDRPFAGRPARPFAKGGFSGIKRVLCIVQRG